MKLTQELTVKGRDVTDPASPWMTVTKEECADLVRREIEAIAGEYREGLFGVLNMDEMENEPLVLLDGGIECRCGETYDFYNGNRTEYGGFLFQYTLRGEGLFVRNGRECLVKKGSGFFVSKIAFTSTILERRMS